MQNRLQALYGLLQGSVGLALMVGWAGLGVFLWRDGKELFAGMVGLVLVIWIGQVWYHWPRRKAG